MTDLEKLQFRTELVKEAGFFRDIAFAIGRPLTGGKLFKRMPKGVQEGAFRLGKKMTEFGSKKTPYLWELGAAEIGAQKARATARATAKAPQAATETRKSLADLWKRLTTKQKAGIIGTGILGTGALGAGSYFAGQQSD